MTVARDANGTAIPSAHSHGNSTYATLGTAAASVIVSTSAEYLRIVATQPAHVKVGPNPQTATVNSPVIPANTVDYVKVDPVAGATYAISFLAVSSAGNISITECS